MNQKKPMSMQQLVKTTESVTSDISEVPSKALSVRIDVHRYTRMHTAARAFEMTHRDVMIEALDLWLKQNEPRLPAAV